ncbi:tetratricopeptide repeat protein [Streptomyces sp. NBC_00885]|uniref:tetratricopeptide repeat protein n=1 Tax=Streptomyces sp. NBC_00885 TaxID=2975857 RepID=UPI00386CCE03|nr:tetratricopeptide repeat protein [Streptomyces sp. NBC_00885]
MGVPAGSAHVHPGLVAVTAGPLDSEGRREFSSGRLIAPSLVLTSRHGVAFGDGEHRPDIEVRLVTGPRGAVRLTEPVPCAVVWQGDAEIDAALLKLEPEDSWTLPAGFVGPRLSWAEATGTEPVPVAVTGMSAAAARSTGDATETETVRGTLDPLTYTRSDRFAVDLASAWPAGWSEWSGMSGSSVLHKGGALVGVVAWSDQPYEGRRLTAVPVRALLADPDFRAVLREHLGEVPQVRPLDTERVDSAPLLAAPSLPSAVRSTLKAPPRRIVDRTTERRRLPELITGGLSGQPELVHAIVGMPGVGKSALARHLAQQFTADFPDVQFELDLYGHTPDQTPLDAHAAVEVLLNWAGIRADDARTLDAKAALWRNWLSGRRALLLLDNAASVDQVSCLLPGDHSSLVLITSRIALHDPDRIVITALDTLPPEESVQLLMSSAGLPHGESDDPVLKEICRACGFLPLAVQAVGARLRFEDPGELLLAMREAESPLLEFPDADQRVGSAFAVSYQALEADPVQAELLRTLAMHPGPDLGAELCAAMTGLQVRECRRRLGDLADRHLLQRMGRNRFAFHDLFLAHARQRAMAQEPDRRWDEVLERVFDHMTRKGEAARQALTTGRDDPHDARAWLDTERANLVAVTLAAARRRSPHARRLAALSHTVLGWFGMPTALASIWTAMRDVAVTDHDLPGQADSFRGLGDAERMRGSWADAQANYLRAREIYEDLGDRRGQAGVMWGLAEVARTQGRHADARELFEPTLTMYEQLGDRRGCGDALWGLGNVALSTGRYEDGADAFARARRIYAHLGDRQGQAQALRGVADIERNRDRPAEAYDNYRSALAIYEEIGDLRGQAQSLRGIGHLERLDGRYDQARDAFTRARDQSARIGDRRGEADMLRGLADVERLLGRTAEARDAFTRAASVHRELGNQGGLAFALRGLGDTECADGRPAEARAAYEEARGIFERIGNRRGLAAVLRGLADLAAHAAEARQAYTEALGIYEELGAGTSAAECRERLAALRE